jgi:hypothetical protein
MEENRPTDVTILPPEKRFPGPGRPKGVPNRMTRLAREAIKLAFDRLGGADALAEWAAANPENKRDFYVHIFPKVLPLDSRSDLHSKVIGVVTFRGLNDG